MDLKRFQFWNAQVIPWITLLAIGSYMASSTKVVLSGGTSLGSFLATVNVYKDPDAGHATCIHSSTRPDNPVAGPGRPFLHNTERLHSSEQVDLTIVRDHPPIEL